MRRWRGLFAIGIALSIIGFVGCREDSKSTPPTTELFDVEPGESVAEVLNRGAQVFTVEFEWVQGAPGTGSGQFFWRRNGSSHRWDAIPYSASERAHQGQLLSWVQPAEGEFIAGLSCSWNVKSSTTLNVDCPGTGSRLSGALGLSRIDRVEEVIEEREIVGGRAVCFLTILGYEYCLNGDGVPLYFKGNSVAGPQEIEARVIALEPSPFVEPYELDDRLLEGHSEIPKADLDLPANLLIE